MRSAGDALCLTTRVERLPRDLELTVEGDQLEVALRHAAHEGDDDAATILLARQELGSRGFGGATEPAPEIDLEREIERGPEEFLLRVHARRQGREVDL
jgi:hypothetical protein